MYTYANVFRIMDVRGWSFKGDGLASETSSFCKVMAVCELASGVVMLAKLSPVMEKVLSSTPVMRVPTLTGKVDFWFTSVISWRTCKADVVRPGAGSGEEQHLSCSGRRPYDRLQVPALPANQRQE